MQHLVIEIFLWLLGLCIGSFLNVVVFRLPRGLSVRFPRRSFCPQCDHAIAGYDNIPVLSWMLLRGRCRHCHERIDVQYPLIEALTGLTFVLAYHLLFVSQARSGLELSLPNDGPLLLSWLVLAGGLIACSAMDVVSYTVDVRVTLIMVGLGIFAHAAWPRADYVALVATTPLAAATIAAFFVSAVALWLSEWRHDEMTDDIEELTGDSSPSSELPPPSASIAAQRLAGGIGVFVLIGLAVAVAYAGFVDVTPGDPLRDLVTVGCLVVIFATTVIVGGQQRPADEEIRFAIEEEQPGARRMALRELKWLLPAMAAGFVVFVALRLVPSAATGWEVAVGWTPGATFTPLAGAAYAIHGAMIAAAAGWVLRIVFTLAFGREAFGTGDIYILAAAGATAGGDIALLGLLLSIGVALVGWLLGLALKSSTMIPFGPWLAIGFFLALFWNQAAGGIADRYADNLRTAWALRPDLVLTAVGLMVVSSVAAVFLARLVRHWVEPDSA